MSGNFLVPIQFCYGAISAESAGPQPGNASQALALAVNGDIPGFAYTYSAGETTIVEAQGAELQSVRLQFTLSGVVAWTSRGELTWYYIDTAGGTAGRSPQLTPTMDGDRFNIEAGSALDLLLSAGEPISGSVMVPNRNGHASQKSSTLGMLYTDALGDIGEDLLTLDRRIRARQGSFTTRSGVTVLGAAAGFNGPDAMVYVAPGDIGGGNDQIPNNPLEVTSDDLENHPSVFLRRTDNLRSIDALNVQREGYDIANPAPLVTTEVGPPPVEDPNFSVFAVVRDPLYVAWRIVADGARYDLLLKVPDNAIGARRPRDLYQATVGPMLAADGSLTAPLFTYDVQPDAGDPSTFLFYRRGLYRKMGYIESVAFIAALDDSTEDILQPVIVAGDPRPIGPG